MREQDLCLICGILAFKIQTEDSKLVKEQGGTVKHLRREGTKVETKQG